MSSTYHVAVESLSTSQTLSFTYIHGLSVPRINPPIGLISKQAPHTVRADYILRFGMLEGDGVVVGKKVVYDPQDALNPRPFGENGSHAEHLAIVANYHEASLLSGKQLLADIGPVLREEHGADVVVIKRGALGATVVTPTSISNVPAFRISNVWPIGSGDVFAATFGHFWGEQNMDPDAAAYRASLATAYYCSTRSLPIPSDIFEKEPFDPVTIELNSKQDAVKQAQVYLAGPFFSMAQRWVVDEARTALLSQRLTVFSPFHDVGHGLAEDVVPADLAALDKSNIVLAILDGLDSGTLFEVGYARANDIPVIAFAQNEKAEDLKMLEGTGCLITSDFVSAIYNTVWKALES
ncbi:MAG: nucleoside 2-deoxyribosyltransferase [Chloroflexi bacterium]|nr:nucleoside 2-deoxyribosyltransferase [Chloroflexota bacterium]